MPSIQQAEIGFSIVLLDEHHLEKATEFCKKSMTVREHRLTHLMLYGWQVSNAPSNKKINLRYLQECLQVTE